MGPFGQKCGLFGSWAAGEKPDTKSKDMITVSPTQDNHPVEIGTKFNALGPLKGSKWPILAIVDLIFGPQHCH